MYIRIHSLLFAAAAAAAFLSIDSSNTCSAFQSTLLLSHKRARSHLTSTRMSDTISAIVTKNAPAPVGPYNQAVLVGNTLYVSGQVALDPVSGEMVGAGDVEEETKMVLKNLDAVLKEAGATSSNVVKTSVFLADLADFAKVNALYAEYFNGPVSPARACVQVAALPKGAKVEIDCVAVL